MGNQFYTNYYNDLSKTVSGLQSNDPHCSYAPCNIIGAAFSSALFFMNDAR